MKMGNSLFLFLIMSFTVLSQVVLAPPPVSAQNVHACVNFTTHLGSYLGGVTTFPFQFAKNCNGYYSYAITWQFIIQDVTIPKTPVNRCNTPTPWAAVPTNGQATLLCDGLTVGAPYKVIVNFTVPPSTLMSHTHSVLNTAP